MTIRVTCDTCGKVLIAKEENAGKKAKCPECGTVLVVPAQEILDAEVDDEYQFSSTNSDNQGDESDNRLPCPACGEEVKKNARKCRYCGEILDPSLKGRSRSKRRNSARRGGSADATADLGKRFLGSLADGLASVVLMAPGGVLLMMASDGDDRPNPDSPLTIAGFVVFGLGLLALLGLQVYLLATRSQSIGKYLLKTQIYDYETNAPASFAKCFLLRGLANGLICAIPCCIGYFYSLVDILFIFGEEHRCLHDQIAGTYVVDIS